MLRSIPDAARVAEVLSAALAAATPVGAPGAPGGTAARPGDPKARVELRIVESDRRPRALA
jgi:hypothetical protein